MDFDGLTLRPFSSMKEYEACSSFQEEIWGDGFSEKVSAAILMIANRIGGLAAGAFDEDGVLHGFVFGLTGVMQGGLIHWSDMLAVRDVGRDRGLGTRLKLYQRAVLLERGVTGMRWTFDPLQGRNAHVNFAKLGVICREYVENMYGETDSPLHRGVGTDRLVAIWEMDSPRVRYRLNGQLEGRLPVDLSTLPRIFPEARVDGHPVPCAPVLGLGGPNLLLAVPEVIDSIMREDMALAVEWREATREAFLHYFSRGFEARDFYRGQGLSSYLLVDAEGE